MDLGITGSDTVAEHEVDYPATPTTGVERILNLGFGKCKLQVQTPRDDRKLDHPQDLIGKDVCTSFMGLTEKYFKELEAEADKEAGLTNGDGGIESRRKPRTKVRRLNGSVESSCALGVAAGVVDLVGGLQKTYPRQERT